MEGKPWSHVEGSVVNALKGLLAGVAAWFIFLAVAGIVLAGLGIGIGMPEYTVLLIVAVVIALLVGLKVARRRSAHGAI
jgi:hypothetical protein